MKKFNNSILFRKLLRSVSVLSIFSILVVAGCSDDKDEEPTPVNPESPTVVSTDPGIDGLAVARNKSISIDFSAEMDAETINVSTFTLMHGTTEIPGTVSYSGTKAVFVPKNTLAANSLYTAKISSGAKDLEGTPVEAKEWSFTTVASIATMDVVNLGAAANYVILAKTGISTVPASVITGDIAVSPNSAESITDFSLNHFIGYAESAQVTGRVYAAEMAAPTSSNLTTAVENMLTAYTDAADRANPDFFELYTGDISGKTLVPGLYKWTNTVIAPTDFTISGGANDIWIFQIAGDLKLSSNVKITLSGGAQAKNIFWQVAGEAVFEAGSHFEGVVLSQTAVHLRTGASMNGRILAQSAVTLQSSTVTKPAN